MGGMIGGIDITGNLNFRIFKVLNTPLMQQEDWLIRQINQLGRVLGKILADLLGLKTKGQVGEGIEAAEQALKGELDLDISHLAAMPTDRFIITLREGKQFTDENFEMLADIFLIVAEELDQNDRDNGKKKQLLEKALIIYEYLDKTGSTYSFERHNKIEKIKNHRL
jgi:hypothetical protein